MQRYSTRGLHVAAIARAGCTDCHITAQNRDSGNFHALCRALAEVVHELDARLVSVDVFGVSGEEIHTFQQALGAVHCPVTWLEGRREHAAPLYGLQAWAVAGPPVEPLSIAETAIGVVFEADGLRYCRLGGLLPAEKHCSRKEQTASIFSLMESGLAAADMTFANVARTWFYNQDMLDWYDDFNAVRTDFFKQRGVFDRLVPASTGIGARNARDAALTAGLLAVTGCVGSGAPHATPSPLQCPSFDYGSAFSRAVEFEAGELRRLYISGTASIEPMGQSAHIDDVEAQINLTLEVMQAILESRDMGWNSVTRAIAYFKDAADAPVLERCCRKRGMSPIPALYANTDICRDDLLFELEADAASQS